MFSGKPEAAILRALGYFDRPAEPAALKLVLPAMEDRKYQAALKRLRNARLILTTDPAQPLDCHPLVREHFAATATREGHARLYDHYSKQGPQLPSTIEGMTPLFYAVYHGCRGGRGPETLHSAFKGRIYRGDKFYLTDKLGAWGTDLSLLASFFETPWTRPLAILSLDDQSWIVSQAGFSLHAVGRLSDAVEPMWAGANGFVTLEDWANAARSYKNLSQLHLTLGKVSAAVDAARQSVDFADRSRDEFLSMVARGVMADALHQSGDVASAMCLFAEAEQIRARIQNPQDHFLLWDHLYCDLLLAQGQTAEVFRRTSHTLLRGEHESGLLDIGLDHLSLGRAHPSGSGEAIHHLDQAVDFLRRAGQLDYVTLALLARGTPHDLAEAFRIATRSGMRLHLSDYHLASTHLALRNGDRIQAREHFAKAESLIKETGYHRRDPDLAALQPQCT
jgi:tetratricopeptide (TPR) repeat protein